jgi:CRP-like cAMP-binding protein
MGLLDHKPRSASIVAVEPTRCYWIAAADFERLTTQHADIAFKLMTAGSITFAERLRAITITLAESDA